MSQPQHKYCPCWEPWRSGCNKFTKTRTSQQGQRPRSSPLGVNLTDQTKSKLALKPPGTTKVKFAAKTYKQPLRKREPQDISNNFEELSPGFTLSQSKDEISVKLGEKFFGKKKPVEESLKPIVPREDVVADLVEQISELTAMMEQLRRDHQTTHKQLEKEMEDKCNEMQEEHEHKIKELETYYESEMGTLEEQYKKEMRTERATAQEKLAGMQKEYKYLKNAFRVYQDSISDEMEEKWLRRQAEWKKSERTEREKALLQQKQSLTRKFEMELEEHKMSVQKNSFLMDQAYQQEREDLRRQHDDDLEIISELNKKIEVLEAELKEKNETLNAIASSLHNTEMELQHEKASLAEVERSIQQRISSIEEKHRINVSTLAEENLLLRRKLIAKNEEIYTIRAQRSGTFDSFEHNAS